MIGSWVNLGADTVTSNLLNTYGEISVRLEPDSARNRTGRMFLGSLIGDHVKTAIGTRLMTGTVLGTGSMIATTSPPPTTVERFAWHTDDGQRRYKIDKFIDMAHRHVQARSLELDQAQEALLRSIHEEVSSSGD